MSFYESIKRLTQPEINRQISGSFSNVSDIERIVLSSDEVVFAVKFSNSKSQLYLWFCPDESIDAYSDDNDLENQGLAYIRKLLRSFKFNKIKPYIKFL